jgi:quercetin dioxygenase-like cupin family protein
VAAFGRRVVTGHDAEGRAVFLSDGVAPKTIDRGPQAVTEVMVLPGPPADVSAGGDSPEAGFPLHPPAGGATVRLIRLPPPAAGTSVDSQWLRVPGDDPHSPGTHTTDTLDFEVIVDGEIVLGLDDGEYQLGAGDVVVQRGTAHRWRVTGDRPCTYLAVMVRPDVSAVAAKAVELAGRPGDVSSPRAPRRLVTGVDAEGRSYAELDGPPAVMLESPGPHGVHMFDLWQTGGPLSSVAQGGDADGWQLEPIGAGVSFRMVELAAGHDPGDAGWHTTETIDVDLILSGTMELALPDVEPVVLEAGDVVVQRGTRHRWRPLGDQPVRMAAVMFALA